jgi:hypothetical protein
MSLEKINLMISTSLLFGTSGNSFSETAPFYNSYFPLTILYTPFKWKYAHLSVYGRGAWETGYTGDMADPTETFEGFYGSLGFRAGFLPLKPNLFRYRAYVITVFSEHTTHHECKLGASIDLLYVLRLILKAQATESAKEDTI